MQQLMHLFDTWQSYSYVIKWDHCFPIRYGFRRIGLMLLARLPFPHQRKYWKGMIDKKVIYASPVTDKSVTLGRSRGARPLRAYCYKIKYAQESDILLCSFNICVWVWHFESNWLYERNWELSIVWKGYIWR